jgi:hypothetical protein
MSFTVFGATNMSVPFTDRTKVGPVQEISPGQFQFNGPLSANDCPWFFLVRSP